MTIITEPLLDRARSRAVDRALAERGMSTTLLMENAGRGAAEHVLALARANGAHRVDVLCGPGNNGGDGLVVTRHLRTHDIDARALTLEDPSRFQGDAAVMRDALVAVAPSALIPLEQAEIDAPIVVDALFGTGLSRALDPRCAALIERCKGRVVVALDVPSGLDADTGCALGAVLSAAVTVTFAASKPGLHTGEGLTRAGVVHVAHLGAPPPIETCDTFLVRSAAIAPRSLDAHKGVAGRVLVIGASPGMTGAGWLSALAAHRAGAGLVTLASRGLTSGQHPVLETMTISLAPEADDAAAQVLDAASRADVVAVGMGLGRDAWARAVLDAACASARSLVIDGDALTLLASGAWSARVPAVLTPHPLEAARLLGFSSAEQVNADRLRCARTLADRYGAVALLKGAGTVIAHPDGRAWILPFAEATLAIAGSGDVLAGAIAARLADRERPTCWHEAVIEGAWMHGRAGARARRTRRSDRGLLAHELAEELGRELE